MPDTMLNLIGHQNDTAPVLKKLRVTWEWGLRQAQKNYRTNVLLVPWERRSYQDSKKRKTIYNFRGQDKLHEDDSTWDSK